MKPVSMVTTVSELVDLLATTFSGDLIDSLTLRDESRLGSMKQKEHCQI